MPPSFFLPSGSLDFIAGQVVGKMWASLARTAENFACRFTTNELSEADERQRQAVLDQIRLFKAAAEVDRLRSPAPALRETEEDRALANFDKIKDSFNFASNDAMLPTPRPLPLLRERRR